MICKVCNKTKALMVSLVTALASNGQLQKSQQTSHLVKKMSSSFRHITL